MYQPKENVNKYLTVQTTSIFNVLQFVYPCQVTLELNAHAPKFYTFMSTDEDGFNSFFHCLIVYEEINDLDIVSDFDKVTNLLKQKKNQKTNKARKDEDNMVGTLEKSYRNELKSKYSKKTERADKLVREIIKKEETDKGNEMNDNETPYVT